MYEKCNCLSILDKALHSVFFIHFIITTRVETLNACYVLMKSITMTSEEVVIVHFLHDWVCENI